jgi:membrane-associated phospholipid phosphatase
MTATHHRMRPAHRRLAAALLLAGAGLDAQATSERRIGDHLSFALPLGTLAVEAWRGDWAGARQLTETFVLTTGVTELLKLSTGVTRPDGMGDTSFPSGHAARAFSAASYVHMRHGIDAAWPLYLAATYVGHTRVQARRHRWSEVAVSAGLAYGFARWRVEPLGAKAEVSVHGDGVFIGLRWQP